MRALLHVGLAGSAWRPPRVVEAVASGDVGALDFWDPGAAARAQGKTRTGGVRLARKCATPSPTPGLLPLAAERGHAGMVEALLERGCHASAVFAGAPAL